MVWFLQISNLRFSLSKIAGPLKLGNRAKAIDAEEPTGLEMLPVKRWLLQRIAAIVCSGGVLVGWVFQLQLLAAGQAYAEECVTDLFISTGDVDYTLPVIGLVTLTLPVVDVTPGSDGAVSAGANAFSCGPNADANGASATAIGDGSSAIGNGTTAVGQASAANAANATVLGQAASATVNALGGVAIGQAATVDAAGAVAIGQNTTASGTGAIAFGQNANASGNTSIAIGQNASAPFANSIAIGQGVATVRNNQVAIGSTSNTYTLAGITSAASRAAQSGSLELVTTDANGNLATDGGQFITILNSLTAVSANNEQIELNRQAIQRNTEGVAMAFALSGLESVLPNEKNYALGAQWGYFGGQNAAAVGGTVRLRDDVFLSGGMGVGLGKGQVGGRAGISAAW